MAEDLVLKSIKTVEGGYTTFFDYDSQNRLVKITSTYGTDSYTIDWTNYASKKVVYKYEYTSYPDDNTVYTVTLGDNNYARIIEEADNSSKPSTHSNTMPRTA